ncbi:TATA box-binding protein-associated factor RNA polymerase I subunit B isoform X2 [Setaria italica]|uniref:TATA box-binding protein-associated factor RNA polymerase I subunit B isoform X2 n=1 Tax=Setaria italica TaxID=4555 RepID=UPI0007199DC5|nr:TATA box-binding protein-associated factor RNA polymerase I subunit B isoform X2 [Setaria italica]XP_034603194.1 TATA box-binding protein-associated factor RNA polymerase I subunit B-like isoform X2 [Setaria viridis]
MDYNPYGGASPDPYGGGGTIRLVCDNCSIADDYSADDAEDGQYTCRTCSAVHATQATAADPHDFPVTGSISVRRVATQPTIPNLATRTPAPYPRTPHAKPAPAAFDDFVEPSEPRDFAPGAGAWGQPEDLAARVRLRYVRGLQVILQRQLQVLVEQHRVDALVCGVAGTIWLRWVAASRVFDDMWARQVLADHDQRSGSGDNNKPDRRKVEFAFLRSLRTLLPIYSTLAVCFLACHIARQAILPSDIYRWAVESKLPYLAVFTEVDKLLGSSLHLQRCPLDARQLFRPVQVIGAWQLEAAAGSIAQRICLRLPSVNFYAIAERCLKDLSLPVDKILPHACRIYEWAMPAELWLSSNPARVPTRVCVMAILLVTLRVLYNINGQGIWEICEERRNAGGSDPDANSPTFRMLDDSNSEEFGMRELLCAIAAAYDKINVVHDYSSDLCSYLKYCNDVIFTGITCSTEEEHLVEIFWDMYKAGEDDNPKEHVKSQSQGIEERAFTNGVNKRSRDGTFIEASCISLSSGHDAVQMLKSEMQDHGFHYMPPRKPRKSDGYLRYRRRRLSGGFVYVAHADYYMLLRAFSKLAEVNVRIMHISVLKLESRLACIEDRIEKSLNTLQNLSVRAKDELRPVSD